MATQQPPDPRALGDWEDAFQYPLPVVRKLEQQLRKNIEDNRQKLRSLVGTSYRDLLGTAERIIDMDNQIQEVEHHMGDIGRKCNARTVERIGDNHKRLKAERGQEERSRYATLAQTKVLQNAIAVTGRLVKKNGDALRAAKLLILARLLHKSLSEQVNPPAVLEELRRKLAQARKRLLAYISRSLVKANVEKDTTVNTLCAYSLISTASPKDVLRYFLQTRFQQLELHAETPSESSLMEMLDLYSRTLLDSRELFPRRFADALSQITKGTLVRDRDVRSVYELSLDVYERWITEDVRNFHPWVRHDQLSTSDVAEALTSWTKQAQSCLLEALKTVLDNQYDAQAVLALRQNVLSKYLSLNAKLRSEVHSRAINDLRTAFLDRLESLAEQAATITDFTPNEQASESPPHLTNMWDLATEPTDLSGGAIAFRHAVLQRQHGRTDMISHFTNALDDWLGRLHKYNEAITSMRSSRWDLDLDLDLDDLEDDDPLQVVLSKQDPQHLEKTLSRATATSLQKAYSAIENTSESGLDPALLIRIVREIDLRRRGLGEEIEEVKTIKPNEEFIVTLQEKIALRISEGPLSAYLKRILQPAHTPITLWDGSPPLPVQPSPAVFRFLKSLQGQMSTVGNDLWSPAAVAALKTHNADKLGMGIVLEEINQSDGLPLTNGHTEAQKDGDDPTAEGEGEAQTQKISEASLRNRLIELMFDVLYLRRIMLAKGSQSSLVDLVDKLKKRLELDATSTERLEKSVNEYWKRTYLLFGLLAT
ncbi:Conserved oligomeric Golgi complex subunit 1 [Pseudocercospora fuligena]|uniref:Conserved oligomeric Golgi complex subunit 1 n=1 Tax=Pseudocercospora fuligena TaxID=685502 RepID=A0A8H6RBW2_9PEZI|nr:Conserved oligomeric Golgi complex subunit 1 [Pseudocercospora fuligena]